MIHNPQIYVVGHSQETFVNFTALKVFQHTVHTCTYKVLWHLMRWLNILFPEVAAQIALTMWSKSDKSQSSGLEFGLRWLLRVSLRVLIPPTIRNLSWHLTKYVIYVDSIWKVAYNKHICFEVLVLMIYMYIYINLNYYVKGTDSAVFPTLGTCAMWNLYSTLEFESPTHHYKSVKVPAYFVHYDTT